MCGRYVNVASDADLIAEFDIEAAEDEPVAPSWNVAPTDPARIVLQRVPRPSADDPKRTTVASVASVASAAAAAPPPAIRELRTARWGLVPSWAKDRKGAARMINARIETVTTKPAFKAAAAKRRCLVPALGYYEWQQSPRGKVPFFLHLPNDATLAMAGLYEFWRDPDRAADDPDRWLLSCTIITQQATDALGEIHDRNPVLVPTELRSAWLDCSSGDVDTASGLLAEIPPARLIPTVVSGAVGNVANNGPQLIEPVGDHDPPGQQALPL